MQSVKGNSRDTISAVADDVFYSPNWKPPGPRVPRPGEPLSSLCKDGATWEAELRYHGEWGVEAQILKNGEVLLGRRFDLRAQAVAFAEAIKLDGTLGELQMMVGELDEQN